MMNLPTKPTALTRIARLLQMAYSVEMELITTAFDDLLDPTSKHQSALRALNVMRLNNLKLLQIFAFIADKNLTAAEAAAQELVTSNRPRLSREQFYGILQRAQAHHDRIDRERGSVSP